MPEIRTDLVIEDLIARPDVDPDRERSVVYSPTKEVTVLLKVDLSEPFHVEVHATARNQIPGELGAETRDSVLVLQHAIEVPVTSVGEVGAPIDDPVLGKPSIRYPPLSPALVDPAHEAHFCTEIWCDLEDIDEPVQVPPVLIEVDVKDVSIGLYAVQVGIL